MRFFVSRKNIQIILAVLIVSFVLVQFFVHPFRRHEKVPVTSTDLSIDSNGDRIHKPEIHPPHDDSEIITRIFKNREHRGNNDFSEDGGNEFEENLDPERVRIEATKSLGEGGIIVLTCCRPEAYQETLNSLYQVREKGNFTIIASHDFYDKDVVKVTDNIGEWKRVIRVINPYRYIYDDFFNKTTFLQYGTKAIKEDDYVVSPDLLIAFREMLKHGRRLCVSQDEDETKGMMCTMNLGCRGDCYESQTLTDFDKLVFFPGVGHTGAVFFREHWDSMRDNLDEFCGNVEDNWDITMEHMTGKNIIPRDSLTLSYSRVLDMKKVQSSRTKDDGSGGIHPSKVREIVMKQWIRDGMEEHRIKDLSGLPRGNIKRVGPSWKREKSVFRTCKRRFTDLCNLMGTDEEIFVKEWRRVAKNVFAPEFEMGHVDPEKLEHDVDHCWAKDHVFKKPGEK